jgi:hypothetical protein
MSDIESWDSNLQQLLLLLSSSTPVYKWFRSMHNTKNNMLNQYLKYCFDLKLSVEEETNLKQTKLVTVKDYTDWILYLNNTNNELIEINRDKNAGQDDIKSGSIALKTAIVLDWKTPLYHGSVRLYSIQCFIDKTKPVFLKYLKDIGYLSPATEEDQKLTLYALDNYEKYMPKDATGNPWTKHIVLLYIVDQMYKISRPFLISKMVKDVYQNVLKDVYRESYLELVDWIGKAEQLKESEVDLYFDISFFSVMRLPIQFFSDRQTAYRYSKKDESKLYRYELIENLKLLNISDLDILNLTQNQMPFNSWESYAHKIFNYYTESDEPAVRKEILYDFIEKDLNLISTQRTETTNNIKKFKTYNWNLNDRLNTSWDASDYYQILEKSAGSTNWYQIISYIVKDLRDNQPEIWLALLEKYNIILDTPDKIPLVHQQLCNYIIQKYPVVTDPDNYHFEGLNEFFDLIYWRESDKLNLLFKRKYQEYITDLFKHLDLYFELRPEAQNFKTDFIFKFVNSHNHLEMLMGSDMIINWNKYFKFDIMSPRGLWISINWFRLIKDPNLPRLSWYTVDTLLVYSLINSKYFKENQFQGWYCKNQYEIMVCQPATYGIITRTDIPFELDRTNCGYEDQNL